MESTDILYIQKQKSFAMKGKQLLSIVFSVIMFTGVTAGSMAFAENSQLCLGSHVTLSVEH